MINKMLQFQLNKFRPPAAFLPMLSVFFLCGFLSLPAVMAQPGQDGSVSRVGYLIQIPLPITEDVAAQVKQQIQRVAEEAQLEVKAEQRPVLLLEFDTSNSTTGQGSELGNCLNIAMQLVDKKLQGLYSVAYIPRPRGITSTEPDNRSSGANSSGSQLKGHAVMVALACNAIAMHEDSSIGQAGADISGDPSLSVELYRNIAGNRLTLPIPFVLAMVDKNRSLYRAETKQAVQFVDKSQLAELEQSGRLIDSQTLSDAGNLPMFSSDQMQRFRLVDRVNSRRDLARRLNVDPATIEGNPSVGGQWNAVQMPIGGYVDAREADWSLRILDSHLSANPDTNLIIVRINASGGDVEPSLRIARQLSQLDPAKRRTVAYVESMAPGASALIAVACDQLIMQPSSKIGGMGDQPIDEQELDDSRPLIRELAEEKQIDWSVPMGLVDAKLAIARYRHRQTGQIRLLSLEEHGQLDDSAEWQSLGDVDFSSGINGLQAQRLLMSRATIENFDQLKQFYQLSESPIELEPSPTDRWIESLARELATPWIAAWLLFGAVFLLSTEMSHPGIGIPGFLGTLCLMLFFWSQYLDGNANWLEVLLFIVGIVFILLEVFVIPGFGVFGIGGLLMVVVAIVLATQTFIIPRNSEELARLPVSLSMVLAAGGGFIAALFVIQKYLHTVPLLKRIMLDPPGKNENISPLQREKRESVVDRSHMLGKTGTAITPLVPAGKAKIGNELVDVITDGRLVEREQSIRVVEVQGNRVLVEPAQTE